MPTPPSLFHLTALLIKHGLLNLDDLYLYVSKNKTQQHTTEKYDLILSVFLPFFFFFFNTISSTKGKVRCAHFSPIVAKFDWPVK